MIRIMTSTIFQQNPVKSVDNSIKKKNGVSAKKKNGNSKYRWSVPKVGFSIWLPRGLDKDLKRLSLKRKISKNLVIVDAIEQYLKGQNGQG